MIWKFIRTGKFAQARLHLSRSISTPLSTWFRGPRQHGEGARAERTVGLRGPLNSEIESQCFVAKAQTVIVIDSIQRASDELAVQ